MRLALLLMVGVLAGCAQSNGQRMDAGSDVGTDAGPLCERYVIRGCSASHPEIDDCDVLYDGREVEPLCPTQRTLSIDCRENGDASYCIDSPGCREELGCVDETWIRFDLGQARRVDEMRFIAGWWADRPDRYEVWFADEPVDDPEAGATLAFTGAAAVQPFRCLAGEPCTEEVPDGCCPNGRDQPQVTDQTSRSPSCDLGDMFPKFDIARFAPQTGRYWWLVIRSGRYDDRIFLHELELRSGCGG